MMLIDDASFCLLPSSQRNNADACKVCQNRTKQNTNGVPSKFQLNNIIDGRNERVGGGGGGGGVTVGQSDALHCYIQCNYR